MAVEYEYISTKLETDSQGKINWNSGLEAKKDWVQLYLDIIRGEVPFSIFGNTIIFKIFKSIVVEEVELFVDSLVNDIAGKFKLGILDRDVTIDNDNIYIKLYLQNDETVNLYVEKVNVV